MQKRFTESDLYAIMNLGMTLRQDQLNGLSNKSGNDVVKEYIDKKYPPFTQIWSGKTKYFDEILDSLSCAGIKTEVKGTSISVESHRISEANGILMNLNQCLNAGW